MKKVVTLVLVLSMVSMASATPTITGPTVISGPGTYTYTVVGEADDAVTRGIFVNLATEGYYASTLPTGITSINGNMSAPLTTTGGAVRMGFVGSAPTVTISAYYVGIKFTATGGTANVPVLAGDWFTFDVVVDSSFTGMRLDASTTSYTTSGNYLDVIPEPATMALLGLGGLLLRRKK